MLGRPRESLVPDGSGRLVEAAMALIQCSECGGQASDKAAACPHCGVLPGGAEIAAASAAKGGPATTGDKIVCLLFPIAWPIVRFVGGRTGAGPYALTGMGIGLLLRGTGNC